MRATPSVARAAGYVLTEKGRYDLEAADRCDCNPRLAGILIECPDCGTIYGSVRDSALDSNAPRWKSRRD